MPPATTKCANPPCDVHDAIEQSGVKVLPVISCTPGSNSGRCDGAAAQAKRGRPDQRRDRTGHGQGVVKLHQADGTGIGSGLAMAVRDLANYLAMDISLEVSKSAPIPPLQVNIQKCVDSTDPVQQQCKAFAQGCNDGTSTTRVPKNTIFGCTPGATPQFFVSFTNPLDPNALQPNPNDPFGGYHFTLQTSSARRGRARSCSTRSPSTSSRTNTSVMPPPPPGAGTYMSSGTYEQQVFGAGCDYYQIEGEGTAPDSCSDGIDNNNLPGRDLGVDLNGDGDFTGPGEIPPDPGCMPGSCTDTVNNDKDMKMGTALTDLLDPDCATNTTQDWSDLFFKANVPAGTSINFDICTGDVPGDLAAPPAGKCTYSRVATIISGATEIACTTNAACKGKLVNGVMRDGFCGTGGQCQFIDPPQAQGHLLERRGLRRERQRHLQRRDHRVVLQDERRPVPVHHAAGRSRQQPDDGPERQALREGQGHAQRRQRAALHPDFVRLVPAVLLPR